jgi:hypothetical protein
MGIDRIGKGPAAPPAPAPPEKGAPAAGPSRAFDVPRESPPNAAPSVAAAGSVAPSSPLARLRAGEIDIHRYLDLKVEEATVHLQGLHPAEMGAVREALKSQLMSDPALADLVQQATGMMPPSGPRDE